TGRRLKRLRERGFVDVEVVGRRPKHRHVLKPTPNLLRTGRLAQVYAGSRAGIDAGFEPASENGSSPTDAGIDGGSGAGEKRREEIRPSLSTPTRDVGAGRESNPNGLSSRPKPAGWIENLNSYTGCREVRGEGGIGHKYDPLGTAKPPVDWKHGK